MECDRMSEHNFFYGLEKLSITSGIPELLVSIRKICCVSDNVFVLTLGGIVCHGIIVHEGEITTLILQETSIVAVDIASNATTLFYVDESGRVFKVSPHNLEDHEEIALNQDSRCCAHGFQTAGHTAKVKQVSATDYGCLFVTENGELWACGEHPQLCVPSIEPQKVLFFDRRVINVACGSDFSLALVNKVEKCPSEKGESDEDEEVFVSNCPSCLSECAVSPVSQQSLSDTCPLGLHIQQPIVDHCSSSTASKDNSADDKRTSDESTSISSRECTAQKQNIHHDNSNECEKTDQISDEIECQDSTSEKILGEETDILNENKSDEIKAEKRNEFFINTDAARQFLTRQLSWVSTYGGAGEDLLVECAEASLVRPSRIIKQNVSTVANLVYEGVKTVGDRVATLSRHMSGGSETSENVQSSIGDFEIFDDLNCDEEKHADHLPALSSSAGTSERGEDSEVGLTEQVTSLVQSGNSLLSVELWSWGNPNHGQLGTGDTFKKNRPVLVSKLSGTGIQKVVCGRFHAVALTLDGRVFAWGKNNAYQVTLESSSDQSSPQQIILLPNSARVKDIAAGDHHTLMLTNDGDVYYMGKQKFGTEPVGHLKKLSTGNSESQLYKRIFCSRYIYGYSTSLRTVFPAVQDLIAEQSFLEEMLLVYNCLVKPLQKRMSVDQDTVIYEQLCVCYNDIISVTCLNVHTFTEYIESDGETSNIVVVNNVEECIRIYRNYLNAVCDIISISGFSHISRVVDNPSRLSTFYSEKMKSRNMKRSQESVVSFAFLNPLTRLNIYKCMVQSLLRCNNLSDHPAPSKQKNYKNLQDALIKWDQLWEEQERRRREADTTRRFWESAGRLIELLRTPERRLIRESRSHPIMVHNSGRFSSHWIILLSDVLVHVSGSSQSIHPLATLWVEPLQDTDSLLNAMVLTMPEETLTLYTPSPHDKTEWLQALQNSIKKVLQKSHSHTPPSVRSATYTFTKTSTLKDAKYSGRWCSGKMQGSGKLVWPDGKTYVGQFQNNLQHGFGKLDIPAVSNYEGEWKDGLQNGYGVMRYACGDLYEGCFKDGVPSGHGVHKQGHFMASVASVYIGEWVSGVKQGYGVMDDIVTGEKYLGTWNNNMKHGCGLIVTLDGIYYEGLFMQDVLVGHGVMVFEDGTHYEGEFKSVGVFNGKGTLTFSSGDYLEGSLHGCWNEGIKVTGTLFKNVTATSSKLQTKPNSFGKLCVPASEKWKAIFRYCYQQMGIPEYGTKSAQGKVQLLDTHKIWENIAVSISSSRQHMLQKSRTEKSKDTVTSDVLDTIPKVGKEKLDKGSYQELRKYLAKAFESTHHPLGALLTDITTAYTATYGGVRVHPLLLNHAVDELHSITARVYEIVRLLFPALPSYGKELLLEGKMELECEVVSAAAILHPILLPRVHSALFVLYALHNKEEDDAYWERLLKWNKQPDVTLMAFLGIDQKFWIRDHPGNCGTENQPPFSPVHDKYYRDAVETLQQLKTTFSPLEKLLVIRSTFEQMTAAVQKELGTTYLWTMDDLFPVFHFVVVRARILQLGSEIHFVEDFMEPYLQNGELGIMFTTLKACYYQILQEKISVSM
ncbi:alsin [Schistocerca americana]|uniref:alsin n=1 Tax=Schistocerca americana TaxID=7009 RepID=UPI001F4F9FBF|nr:alsin [Schistocerca americana]